MEDIYFHERYWNADVSLNFNIGYKQFTLGPENCPNC